MLSFYVRNPRDSLLEDEGSTGLRSHKRLSDKETVKTGWNSCETESIPCDSHMNGILAAPLGTCFLEYLSRSEGILEPDLVCVEYLQWGKGWTFIWVEIINILSLFIVTWCQNEPSKRRKKHPVDTFTKESHAIAVFIARWLNLKQLTFNSL